MEFTVIMPDCAGEISIPAANSAIISDESFAVSVGISCLNLRMAESTPENATVAEKTTEEALREIYSEGASSVFILGSLKYTGDCLETAFLRRVICPCNCTPALPRRHSFRQARSEILCNGRPTIEYIVENSDEQRYLSLLREAVQAPAEQNRTGVPTRRLFCRTLRFCLDKGGEKTLPLLTTKRMPFKAIVAELLWFLRGSTNTDFLVENNVGIWSGNSSREFLDSRGLSHYREGELGPIYGFQWRHYGAEYTPECRRGGESQQPGGLDQIAAVIESLRRDPFSRRHVVTAWNPLALGEMALPPCHFDMIFSVTGKKILLQVNMRSADLALGVPFNIASYAILAHIVGHLTGLVAAELAIVMTDCHVYETHLEAVREQTLRTPRTFPLLQFSPRLLSAVESSPTIDTFAYADLADYTHSFYNPDAAIRMSMAV